MFNPVDPKPNFPKLEGRLLAFWEKEKIFEKSLEQTKNGKPFTFYDGQPFATGLPHYGHILASTIKDVIPRYQTMKGRYVRRRWGWDCHGLPIEEIVERQLKISGKKQIEEIGIKKFNEICRSKVLEYVGEWRKTVRRIARWVDFDNSYKTMDRDYMESVWWGFKQIYDNKLVYEGRKVLLYCPRCETPVSNFEVAMDNSYKDVTEEAVIVKFKLKSTLPQPLPSREGNSSPLPGSPKSALAFGVGLRGEDKGGGDTYFLAWTTTPWTLPANIGLAVGSKITYVIFRISNENQNPTFIATKDRLATIAPNAEIIKEIKGSDLVGLEYEPLFDVPDMKSDKSYRVYAGDFVNTEEGTGIVHISATYGEDDHQLAVREGIPIIPLLDEKGKFNQKAPESIRGQYFKNSEKVIKKDLEGRGLLFERKSYLHSYPHCWRCSTALYYNAIPAWFINIQKIKKKLLKSNDKEINWFPEHLKHGRYEKSVEAAPDWNISRNRYWGNPIPVWKCEKCGKNTVVGSVAELKEKVVSGYQKDLDLHRPYIDEVILKCDHPAASGGAGCGGEARRIAEIFDSWVEAGSMPFAEFHYPFENKKEFESRLPAQFVTEYIAQTRAWFYVMHVISVILFGKAPFENVLTTGTLMAEDGNKLSKSKRNFPDPDIVIEKYGVDSLRFYLMNSVVMQADNQNFSEKDLATTHRKTVLILWNVYNYFIAYANEAKWDYAQETKPSEQILDQWVYARIQELINEVSNQLDAYNTVRATRALEEFISDLSTWYLRRSRGRSDSDFFTTLRHCLIVASKVTAPFTPYISEEIYQNLTPPSPPHEGGIRGEVVVSVHLASWPETRTLGKKESELLAQMAELRKIVEQVHALRAKAGIKLRQPLAKLTILKNNAPPSLAGASRGGQPPLSLRGGEGELLEILKGEVNVKEVVFGDKLELDTNLSEDLKLEGLTAELTRQIQQLRKDSGLKIGEMATLEYQSESDIIKRAMQAVDRKKTYLANVEYGISNMEGKEMEIEGGLKLKLALRITN